MGQPPRRSGWRFDPASPRVNRFRLWLARKLNGAYTFNALDRWLYPDE